jgi:hypothetical protein
MPKYSAPEEKFYDEAKIRFGSTPKAILAFPLQTMEPERFAKDIAPKIIHRIISHVGGEMDVHAYSQQEAFMESQQAGIGHVMTLFFIAIFSKKNPKKALDRLCWNESNQQCGYDDVWSLWRAYKLKQGVTSH